MLKINNLEVATDNKIILKDFNLIINDGEIHTIMGPNGVGKSTLSRVIMGDPNYKVLNGEMTFNGDNLMVLSTDERAKKGIFLAMQYPMEIEGVSNQDFLRTAIGSVNNKRIGLYDFILKCEKGAEELSMNKELIHRSLNVGFSGGEKKKNEVLQIKLLTPKFIILDELDSGLDVDSLRIVGENIKKSFGGVKRVHKAPTNGWVFCLKCRINKIGCPESSCQNQINAMIVRKTQGLK